MMMDRMQNWLYKRAYLTPNRPAIFFENKVLTFADLYNESIELAGKLTASGIEKNNRIAVLMNNHLHMVVLLHALHLIGCEIVLLNTRLHARELLYQIRDSKTVVLITTESFIEKADFIREHTKLPVLLYSELCNQKAKDFQPVLELNMDDICTIMYTSGTTGFPKGVVHTYGNHWWSAVGSVLNLGLDEKDCWLCTVPLFHISGFSILMRSLIYGMPVYLFEKFDEEKVNTVLKNGEATIISVVTNMLQRMVDALGDDYYHPDFRCALLGGGPVPLALLERCKEKNIPVFQSYGLTETASQIVTLSPEDSLKKLGSAGKPLFPSQVRIVNKGKEAKPNEFGEIMVKGPNVTKGYLYREEENKKSFTSDGWFSTGDVGYLDEDGFLYVIDRLSDMIISGGENIYPAEIENVLASHPAIQEAGVVGIPDDVWGEVPCAFYVVRTGHSVEPEDLARYCQNYLAKYKVPKKWFEIDELPRNASNKLLRRKLREFVT